MSQKSRKTRRRVLLRRRKRDARRHQRLRKSVSSFYFYHFSCFDKFTTCITKWKRDVDFHQMIDRQNFIFFPSTLIDDPVFKSQWQNFFRISLFLPWYCDSVYDSRLKVFINVRLVSVSFFWRNIHPHFTWFVILRFGWSCFRSLFQQHISPASPVHNGYHINGVVRRWGSYGLLPTPKIFWFVFCVTFFLFVTFIFEVYRIFFFVTYFNFVTVFFTFSKCQ